MFKKEKEWTDDITATVPVVDEKNYGDIANLIKKQIKTPKVYNIGIVAPYGAGKSSAIETYKSKINFLSKKHICQISVANFDSIINSKHKQMKNNKKANGSISNVDEQTIERSVLQQIIYKNESIKVKDSRFSRIGGYAFLNVLNGFIATICLFFTLAIAFQFFENPFFISEVKTRVKFCNYSACFLFIFVLILMINIIKKNILKKIKVADFEFEKNDTNEVSIFNQYIDEIIYRFRKLHYNVVIIEDLDRFDNHYIFAKLKELCTLINSNNKIRWKVSFVYAIKDSMFLDEEERSKFFDIIIPVIPSLANNSANQAVGDAVITSIGENVIKKELIDDIAPYVKNRRVLINIINDYLLYKNKLGEVNPNSLFALMVYKNIKPEEFEDIQLGKGVFFDWLKTKKYEIIKSISNSFRQK